MIQIATETMETARKGSVLEACTQTKCTDICFACVLDDMFSGFNSAQKSSLVKVNAIGMCE